MNQLTQQIISNLLYSKVFNIKIICMLFLFLQEELLDEKNNIDLLTQMNESFEFILPNDPSTDASENITVEIIEETTNNDKEEVMIDVSHLLGSSDDDKENNLSWDDVLSNLRGTSANKIDISSVKAEIPEDITKIFNSQQYTIMYIPKSLIDSTTEISIPDTGEEEKPEDDTLCNTLTTIKILEKQEENIEDNLHNVYSSKLVKSKTATKRKRTTTNQTDDSMEDKETSQESCSNIEQFPPQIEDVEESDSDYIDPKDNILGSLNDMITRIKELKEEGTTTYQCTLCLQNYDQLIGA